MVMHIAAQHGWATQKFYFSNAFVKDALKEEVYVEMPDMFSYKNANSEETVVLKLCKSLYRLVQAPRTWYQHLQKCLKSLELDPSELDKAMYFRLGMIVTT